MIKRIIALDIEMVGKIFLLEYDQAFGHISTIIEELRHSSYGNQNSYRLKDEILVSMYESDPRSRSREIPQYPQKFFAMPLWKSMKLEEVRGEMKRRGLVSAGAVDALCFAVQFDAPRNEGINVLDAVYQGKERPPADKEILALGRNGHGDPMLHLTIRNRTFFKGECFLVKRKTD